MTTQPEQVLENNLIRQLVGLGHKSVTIKTEDDLVSNLKSQLEKHNKTTFTTSEFDRILIHLSKGNIFDKAKTLRDKYVLQKDNGDKAYIEFINQDFWCQNQFQVTNQVTIHGKRENRYDVTILINGLPLVSVLVARGQSYAISLAFSATSTNSLHTICISQRVIRHFAAVLLPK